MGFGKRKTFVLFIILYLVPFYSAYAANETILQAENAFSAAIGMTHLGYGETGPATVSGYLDTENGYIPIVTLEGSFLDDRGSQKKSYIYFAGKMTLATGATAYDGYGVQQGALIPVSTTNLSNLIKTDSAFGLGVYLSPNLILIPNLQLGTHYWWRTVQPNFMIAGVSYENREDYHHYYIGVGLKSDYALTNKIVISLAFDARRTFNSQMHSSGTGDTYTLGDSSNLVGAVKITYEFKKDINLFAGFSIETFSYGKSDLQPDFTLEPDSKTQLTQYTLGAAYAY